MLMVQFRKVVAYNIGHGDVGLFSLVAGTAFVATSVYPLGIAVAIPSNYLLGQLGVEASWMIHTWLMMPLAIGALAVSLRRMMPRLRLSRNRSMWVAVSVVLAALLGWSVYDDSKGIPSPAFVERVNGVRVRSDAVKIDACLRNPQSCGNPSQHDSLLSNVDACLNANRALRTMFLEATLYKGQTDNVSTAVRGRLGYLCGLIEAAKQPGVAFSLQYSYMRYIAWFLNWTLYACSFCFVGIVLLLVPLANESRTNAQAREMATNVLSTLVITWVIFALWFPLKLLSIWKYSYYQLTLIGSYAPFWATLIFVVITFFLLAYSYVVIDKRLNPKAAIISIAGFVGTSFGVVTALKPEWIPVIFRAVDTWPAPIVVLIVLFFTGILLHLAILIIEGTEATSPRSSIVQGRDSL
jgi:hypothetical protein